eukprot:SAG22_NODE_6180_length_888_cov_1.656962_2_plen_35_part_01
MIVSVVIVIVLVGVLLKQKVQRKHVIYFLSYSTR